MTTQNIALLTLTIALTGTASACRFITPTGTQTAADGNAIGVSRTGGISGDKIAVDIDGTAVIESGAAFALGATLKADATGRGITWVTSGGKVAIALEAATAAGQFVEVLLIDNAA